MSNKHLLLLLSLLSISLCKIDPSTFSNYKHITQTNLEGNFFIDFDRKVVKGTVKLHFTALKCGELIVLDTKSLSIKSIVDPDTGDDLTFVLDTEYSLDSLGTPLKIYKDYHKGDNISVLITYETTDEGSAVQWLSPESTSGKVHPFMFTQCESILARELLPIQDTPDAKITVSVGLTVKNPLRALFAGIYQNKIDMGNYTTYFYDMKIPIPSYLIAFVAGDIDERKVGPRTTVYAEKDVVEKAAKEFNMTEKFIEIAESYLIPYEWGQYNLVVLPPSFPYGGMENPTLTFVTPSLLAGDQSLVDVVAHEIGHSWSGNLVTMRAWDDFFLNEGFTMFIERKIMTEYRKDVNIAKMDALIGLKKLNDDIKKIGESKNFSSLKPYLIGRDYDDAFSNVPYEKGFNFLYYMEQLVNSYSTEDVFKKILKKYFTEFKFKSIDYEMFKNFFIERIKDELKDKAEEALNQIDWKNWVFDPGFPKISNNFTNNYSIEVLENLEKFYNEKLGDDFVKKFKGWHTLLKQYFLDGIYESKITKLTPWQKSFLVQNLSLAENQNSEVAFRFFSVLLTKSSEITQDEYNSLISFLGLYGRMKYIRVLYVDFYKVNKELCLKTFNKLKSFYHPIAIRLIELDFKKINI